MIMDVDGCPEWSQKLGRGMCMVLRTTMHALARRKEGGNGNGNVSKQGCKMR